MRRSGILNYCNKVSKQLICRRSTKKDLIAGLQRELAESPSYSALSAAQLQEVYAPINVIVSELQALVPSEERVQILHKHNRSKKLLIAALVAIILIISVSFVSYVLHDLHYVDQHIVG